MAICQPLTWRQARRAALAPVPATRPRPWCEYGERAVRSAPSGRDRCPFPNPRGVDIHRAAVSFGTLAATAAG
jgi:hypothetical protein